MPYDETVPEESYGKRLWQHLRALRFRRCHLPAMFAGLFLLVFFGYVAQRLALRELEHEGIEVKAIGRETPLDFGVPYETLTLPLEGRLLQARLVRGSNATSRAILIFHGNGEAISDWSRVQALLHDAGLSSMVFDYSGFGNSTGEPSVAHLREDSLAAYRAFVQNLPAAQARYVIGHSLGNAVMLDVLPALQPKPTGVVVHAGFTSAREMAIQTGLAAPWLASFLPNLWDNEAAMAKNVPIALVMHSDADEVIPQEMGVRLAAAAGPRAHFLRLHALKHDSLYQESTPQEWRPIIDFVQGPAPSDASLRLAVAGATIP